MKSTSVTCGGKTELDNDTSYVVDALKSVALKSVDFKAISLALILLLTSEVILANIFAAVLEDQLSYGTNQFFKFS